MKKLILLAFVGILAAAVPFAASAGDGQSIYKKTCAGCHGQKGEKVMGAAALKDLSADEIAQKLKGYADGTFGGSQKVMMQRIVKKLSDADAKAVADYAGSL